MTWNPPPDWTRFEVIDAHTAGEPLRVITSGLPSIPGGTILAKRRYAEEHLELARRVLMWEPRGHADMYGAIPTEPVTEDGDIGVLFLHNEGWSTMCGHGIIGLVKVGLEFGLFTPKDERAIRIDTPAGRVTACANRFGASVEGVEFVESVSFRNVPSFLLERDLVVEVPGLGPVPCDIGFGGAFYAYVDARAAGVTIAAEHAAAIIDAGMRIKRAVMESYEIVHPTGDADLNFLYGTILVQQPGPGSDPNVHSRNACVFADGELDRSPTGTGVSGRAAVHFARGELELGETITIESVLGTSFDVRAIERATVGEIAAIIPEVTGSAYVTGRNECWVDPSDPLRGGFLLGR